MYIIVSVLEEPAGFMCREYNRLIVKTQKTSVRIWKMFLCLWYMVSLDIVNSV